MLGEKDLRSGLADELIRRLEPRWQPLPHQVPPTGNWYGWLILGGRGSGKTDACTSYVDRHAMGPPCIDGPAPHWIGIIAPTLGDAVTSCFSGPAGIRAHNPHARLVNSAGGLVVRWPNGAEAKLFGASNPDDIERLRAGGNRCVVANTLIRTARGQIPIEQIQVGELVYTRRGLRRVLWAEQTGVRRVWRLETEGGRELIGTADHEIPTARGDVEMQFLAPGDTISTWQTTSHTTASGGDGGTRRGTFEVRDVGCCTGMCGHVNVDRSHVECTSITASRMTDTPPTSNDYSYSYRSSTRSSIPVGTSRGTTPVRVKSHGRDDNRSGASVSGVTLSLTRSLCQQSSVDSAPAASVDQRTTSRSDMSSPAQHTRNGCALCAALSSAVSNETRHERAHIRVVRGTSRRNESNVTVITEDTRVRSVLSVASSSPSTATGHVRLVQDRVLRVSQLHDVVPVYDLMVEHDHEFFANDILVWNCLTMLEEFAAFRYMEDAWDHMRFGLRVGPRPHWIGATTPKPRTLIKRLNNNEFQNVVLTRATINDNPHLSAQLRADLVETYKGTRLGAQELEGRLVDQDPDALWRREDLDLNRLSEPDTPLRKITVGIDPSGGAGEQGVIVVARGDRNTDIDGKVVRRPHGYVLADRTCRLTPAGWGRRAVDTAVEWDADDICVEVNYGGDMAIANVRGVADAMGLNIPVRAVRATRGKAIRAEPVASLSDQTRRQWHLCGNFPELEDQLCTWTSDLDWSPDRLDAMVWPAWHLKIVSVLRVVQRGSYPGEQAALSVVR